MIVLRSTLEAERRELAQELIRVRAAHSAEIVALRDSHARELLAIRTANQRTLDSLLLSHSRQAEQQSAQVREILEHVSPKPREPKAGDDTDARPPTAAEILAEPVVGKRAMKERQNRYKAALKREAEESEQQRLDRQRSVLTEEEAREMSRDGIEMPSNPPEATPQAKAAREFFDMVAGVTD